MQLKNSNINFDGYVNINNQLLVAENSTDAEIT